MTAADLAAKADLLMRRANSARYHGRDAEADALMADLRALLAEPAPLDAFSQADERRRVGAKLRDRLAEGGESGRRLVRVQPVYDERFVALTGALGADVFPTGGAQ